AMNKMCNGPERARGFLEYAFDVGFNRHVTLEGDRFSAGRLHSFRHFGCGITVISEIDGDVIAALASQPRAGRTDPTAPTRNQKHRPRHERLSLIAGRAAACAVAGAPAH